MPLCVTRELEQAYFRHIIDQKFMLLYFRNISPEALGIAPFLQAVLPAEFIKKEKNDDERETTRPISARMIMTSMLKHPWRS